MLNKPCRKCGAIDRYKSGDCRPCSRVTQTVYNAAHKDKKRAYDAARYAANKEKANALSTAWYVANKEKVRALNAARYAANKEKVITRVAVWAKDNQDKVRSYKAVWAKTNPGKLKASRAAWYAAHKDEVNERSAAWIAANPEKRRAYQSAWRKANPEKNRAYLENRRARKLKNGGQLSVDIAGRLYKLQKGKCPCCHEPLGNDYHLDHIMPLALGGTNTDDNIQLLRAGCNVRKCAKHPIEFMQERGFLL